MSKKRAQFVFILPFLNSSIVSLGPIAKDSQMIVDVTLEQLYTGHEFKIPLRRHVLCRKCHGRGADPHLGMQTCSKCGGTGVHVTLEPIGPTQHYVRRV